MGLNKIKKAFDKLHLKNEDKKALINIIEVKVDYEMEKVIRTLKSLNSKLNFMKWSILLLGVIIGACAILLTTVSILKLLGK